MYDYSMENAERERIKNELNKFNWGAFGFGWIWAIFNGAWNDYFPTLLIMIAVVAISKIPVIGPVFRLICPGITIYVGTKGNEWAYNGTKNRESIERFQEVQKKWAIAFAIYFVVGLIVVMFVAIYAAKYYNPANKLCNSYVKEVVSAPDYAKFNSGKDIAEYFVKSNPNMYSLYGEDGDTVFTGGKNKYGDAVKFFKYGDCSLEKYNCYMVYNSVILNIKYQPVRKEEQILIPAYKVFFDDKGKTKFIKIKADIKLEF